MSLLGIFGIVLGLAGFRFAFQHRTGAKLALLILAFLLHLATSFAYWQGVQTSAADTYLYYEDPYGNYGQGFGLSTQLILSLVQWVKLNIGGTYLDFFLVFQAFGFWGIALLMRILDEISSELGIDETPIQYLLLFLPSVHYWSSAIGKDAPHLFATCLILWSVMRMRERLIPLAAGMVLLLAVRPHIAMLALAALAAAMMIGRSLEPRARIALGLVALIGAGFALSTVETTFQVDLRSSESIGDLLEQRENILETEDAGSTAVRGSYPVRVFSLLFRPLFFDASGLPGLAASFENLLLLVLGAILAMRYKSVIALSRNVFFVRFALIYAAVLILMLALTYYNVGLGNRQKAVMISPALIVLLMVTMGLREARRRQALAAAPGLAS